MPQVRDAHNAEQMKRIREEDAKLKAKELEERVPESLEKVLLCDFRIKRYRTTDLRGMFEVIQYVYRDGKKVDTRKIIEGVFMDEAITALEKALRWRAFDYR